MNKKCQFCGNDMLFNVATRQYYCLPCGASSEVQLYGAKQPKNPKKKDCGCGRKKRKS